MKKVFSYKRSLINSFLLFLSASGAFASPKVDNITGSLTHDSTVTILGSGFSELENPVRFYDHVGNQEAYEALQDGSPIPVEKGPWTSESHWGTPVEIVRDGDLRSSTATAAYYGEGKAYLGWPKALEQSTLESIYVSWWFKPSQLVDQGGSNKFIRIWDDPNGEGTRISWTQVLLRHGSGPVSWEDTQPAAGKWNRFEIFVDSKRNIVTAILNGVVEHGMTDFQKKSVPQGLNIGLVGFDPSISDKYPDFEFRMTDIYFSETQARLELSNSPTWDLKSHRELLDIVDWSSTKIEAKINAFGFEKLDSLYLYVIDKDGNVNKEGFPICEKCPNSPIAFVE